MQDAEHDDGVNDDDEYDDEENEEKHVINEYKSINDGEDEEEPVSILCSRTEPLEMLHKDKDFRALLEVPA